MVRGRPSPRSLYCLVVFLCVRLVPTTQGVVFLFLAFLMCLPGPKTLMLSMGPVLFGCVLVRGTGPHLTGGSFVLCLPFLMGLIGS